MADRKRRKQPDYALGVLGIVLGAEINADIPIVASVPPGLMKPLIEAMAAHLAVHRGHDTSGLPPKLRPFATFKKQNLLDKHQQRLLEGLWDGRGFSCVDDTIAWWIKTRPELKAAVEDGSVLSGSDLVRRLSGANRRRNLSELASMLWACRLEAPERAPLFRTLIALFNRDAVPTRPAKAGPDTELKAAQEELRQVRKRLRSETDASGRLASQLLKARNEAAEHRVVATNAAVAQRAVERNLKELEARRAKSDARLRAADEAADRLSRAEARAKRQAEAALEELTVARRDLRASTESEARLMTERTDIVKQLQTAEARAVEHEGPKGSWAFLVSREAELDDDVIRLQAAPGIKAREQLAALRKLKRAFLETYPEFVAPRPAPSVAIIKRGRLSYRGLGGAEGIGASAYLIELAGHRILVDCGIKAGADLEASHPDIAGLARLDAVILTHAHTDHVGWLPALAKQLHGKFEIVTTKQTHDLIHVMLDDSQRHLQTEIARRRLQEKYSRTQQTIEEPYGRSDVDYVLDRVHPVTWSQEFQLKRGLSISLHPAGHILGAASILLEGDNRKVIISGDFATFEQRSVGQAIWPEHFQRADLLVMESTYGAHRHNSRDSEVAHLVETLQTTIRGGGTAIVPCFALGRAQEVLTIISDAMKARALNSCPVWIDGMIQRIDAVYREHGWLKLPDEFAEVRAGGYKRSEVIDSCRRTPSIVVTTSGMLYGGPGVEYAADLLGDGRNRLCFTGYLDEESPGKRMLRLAEGSGPRQVRIPGEDGKERIVRLAAPAAKVQLSAHSDQDGLIAQALKYEPQHVVLVHGEDDARTKLREQLTTRGLSVEETSLEFRL